MTLININKDKIMKDNLNKKKELIKNLLINNFIKKKLIQKNKNNYNPNNNNKKYLIIIACHVISHVKFNTILNNIKYFDFECMDKILINSLDTNYKEKILSICEKYKNTNYYEIENSKYYDFGKWIYVLQNLVDINNYDYVIFTNDSFTIHNSINHFFNLTYKYNVELFGYNDSTQNNYHYQSYIFSIKKEAIDIFINKINNPSLIIRNQNDVIENFELLMTNWFKTTKCFLQIGNFNFNKNHNIFFTNDFFYLPLKTSNLLPFTKIKRNNI